MKWLLLFLCLHAHAWGLSSAQLWSDGTRSAELVPDKELDVTASGRFPDEGIGIGGLRLEYGFVLFKLESMLSLDWLDSFGQRREIDLGFREKLSESGLPLALYVDLTGNHAALESSELEAGFATGWELGDHEFALDLGVVEGQTYPGVADAEPVFGPGNFDARLGYRGPYITWTLRPGIEAHWTANQQQFTVTPQILINLPGDVSIQCGVKFSVPDNDATTLLLALSYEIFPSP